MQSLWPWQEAGIKRVIELLGAGELSVCVTAPTGMGKGKMLEGNALHVIESGGKVILFTNRKMLTKQTGDRFSEAGIEFGYASASLGVNTQTPMTVASVQTVTRRVSREVMALPHADLVLIDEAHNRGFDKMLTAYREANRGVAICGYTATPVGLKGKYDHLVIAGTKRDGRQHGALVPCHVFAPSEPDMRGVRMNSEGEYVQHGMVKRVVQCTVFSDIFDTWQRRAVSDSFGFRPTMVWAPGVPESKWIVEQFRQRGISAEHIDSETSDDERARIADGSRDGQIAVVSSFGVLREGVDWPWISYGILVQVCGAITTYLQVVGRILRMWPGKHDAILQDHSGAWWRHGSPNEDREWTLDDTNQSIAKSRKKAIQNGEKKEGICCPKCGGIRAVGPTCPHCGYQHTRSVRMVRTINGELVRMQGSVVKRKKQVSPAQKAWNSALYRCGSTGRTLKQAVGLFNKETGGSNPLPPPDVQPQPAIGDPLWHERVNHVYPRFNRRRHGQYA